MKNKKGYPFFSAFTVCAAVMALLMPIRIYQYFKVLEPDTGFYAQKDFSVYVMYVLLAFISVFSIAVAFLKRKSFRRIDVTLKPINAAIVYSLAAVGFAVDSVKSILSFLDVYNEYSGIGNGSMWNYISQSGSLVNMLQGILGLICAIYFFALAVGSAIKKNLAPSLKLIALAAPLWAVSKLLIKFKTTISFINVSDLFIELLAVVFLMMFLLAFVQTQSQVDKGESYWKMYAYGIPAAVLCLTCFVPRMVLVIIGRADLLCEAYAANVCDFTSAILIISTLISRANEYSDNKNA